MIIDGILYEVGIAKADHNEIFISTKDNKKRAHIAFSGYKTPSYDINAMPINKRTDITKYIYWDISLTLNDTYIIFDISKDHVYLTRINEKEYKLEIIVVDPDIIYSPQNKTFKTLNIDVKFKVESKD